MAYDGHHPCFKFDLYLGSWQKLRSGQQQDAAQRLAAETLQAAIRGHLVRQRSREQLIDRRTNHVEETEGNHTHRGGSEDCARVASTYTPRESVEATEDDAALLAGTINARLSCRGPFAIRGPTHVDAHDAVADASYTAVPSRRAHASVDGRMYTYRELGVEEGGTTGAEDAIRGLAEGVLPAACADVEVPACTVEPASMPLDEPHDYGYEYDSPQERRSHSCATHTKPPPLRRRRKKGGDRAGQGGGCVKKGGSVVGAEHGVRMAIGERGDYGVEMRSGVQKGRVEAEGCTPDGEGREAGQCAYAWDVQAQHGLLPRDDRPLTVHDDDPPHYAESRNDRGGGAGVGGDRSEGPSGKGKRGLGLCGEGGDADGRAAVLARMLEEKKRVIHAAYNHACHVFCTEVALRVAELRIVMRGVGVVGDHTHPTHADATTTGDTFNVSLLDDYATAQSLQRACTATNLLPHTAAAAGEVVTAERATLARQHLIKLIKGDDEATRSFIINQATPVESWGASEVYDLMSHLGVQTSVSEGPLRSGKLDAGAAALILQGGLSVALGVESSILKRRIDLYTHMLRAVHAWEARGVWPGPVAPEMRHECVKPRHAQASDKGTRKTHVGVRRRRRSSATALADKDSQPGTTPDADPSATLHSPIIHHTHTRSTTTTVNDWVTRSSDGSVGGHGHGFSRLTPGEVWGGMLVWVAPLQELIRVFRSAWRAYGLDRASRSTDATTTTPHRAAIPHASTPSRAHAHRYTAVSMDAVYVDAFAASHGGSNGEASVIKSLDECLLEMEHVAVASRYGRVVLPSPQSANGDSNAPPQLPSAFVQVELHGGLELGTDEPGPVLPATRWVLPRTVAYTTDNGPTQTSGHSLDGGVHAEVDGDRRVRSDGGDGGGAGAGRREGEGLVCGDRKTVVLPVRGLFAVPEDPAKWFLRKPQLLALGRRVYVVREELLRACLSRAAWVDTQSTFDDILCLAGQEAHVVCVDDVRDLGRVGVRTIDGLEDAVPLDAIEPVEDGDDDDVGGVMCRDDGGGGLAECGETRAGHMRGVVRRGKQGSRGGRKRQQQQQRPRTANRRRHSMAGPVPQAPEVKSDQMLEATDGTDSTPVRLQGTSPKTVHKRRSSCPADTQTSRTPNRPRRPPSPPHSTNDTHTPNRQRPSMPTRHHGVDHATASALTFPRLHPPNTPAPAHQPLACPQPASPQPPHTPQAPDDDIDIGHLLQTYRGISVDFVRRPIVPPRERSGDCREPEEEEEGDRERMEVDWMRNMNTRSHRRKASTVDTVETLIVEQSPRGTVHLPAPQLTELPTHIRHASNQTHCTTATQTASTAAAAAALNTKQALNLSPVKLMFRSPREGLSERCLPQSGRRASSSSSTPTAALMAAGRGFGPGGVVTDDEADTVAVKHHARKPSLTMNKAPQVAKVVVGKPRPESPRARRPSCNAGKPPSSTQRQERPRSATYNGRNAPPPPTVRMTAPLNDHTSRREPDEPRRKSTDSRGFSVDDDGGGGGGGGGATHGYTYWRSSANPTSSPHHPSAHPHTDMDHPGARPVYIDATPQDKSPRLRSAWDAGSGAVNLDSQGSHGAERDSESEGRRKGTGEKEENRERVVVTDYTAHAKMSLDKRMTRMERESQARLRRIQQVVDRLRFVSSDINGGGGGDAVVYDGGGSVVGERKDEDVDVEVAAA